MKNSLIFFIVKIFIIIFDTLRKDHTGRIYGNNWIKTPSFDNFAKDSLVFEKAYPESLPTIPARRAIHTGIRTFPFNHENLNFRTNDLVESPGWAPIPPYQNHLAEYMNSNAYITSLISSTYHYFKPNMNFHLGFDEWHFIRGHEYDNYRARYRGKRREINSKIRNLTIEKTKLNRGEVHTQKLLLKKYLPNIQDRKNEEDYFPAKTFKTALTSVIDTQEYNNVLYFIDEFDPHEPWDPPDKYLDLYLDKEYDGNLIIQPIYGEKVDYLSENELKCMRACYAGEVSLCDNWFGYFIDNLKKLEIYEESLIILTSDHGHSLGEHGAIGKIPVFMYPELVDIPFIIKPPGNINGPKRISKSFVYHHDILPTLYGFLNKEPPGIFDGKDLSIFVENEDHLLDSRDYITCGMALWTLCRTDDYALITGNNKTDKKLFNIKKDPLWNENIVDDNPDICDELFQKILRDSNNDLLKDFKSSRFVNFKDWYHNTYLT
ncbi:MAG: sulfatase-like hydrolase/transferase [Candidatus Lokiarchaeota archaeon]|nr:sulfatase-like hydrolase/transferase [Candidatus Lokiarchaeota archaeon]MBD3213151.1 sulfatase-like hydrolase/transferase [Candidatus Lokiarchaeota archaeon]